MLIHAHTVDMKVIRIQNQNLQKCPNLTFLYSNVLYCGSKTLILKKKLYLQKKNQFLLVFRSASFPNFDDF